jgi:hypothetical protein
MPILGTWCAGDMLLAQTFTLDAWKDAWGHSEWSGHLRHDCTLVWDEFMNGSCGHTWSFQISLPDGGSGRVYAIDGCYKLVVTYFFVGNLHWYSSNFSNLTSVLLCTIPFQDLQVPLTQSVEIAITSSHPTVPSAQQTLSLGQFWIFRGLADVLHQPYLRIHHGMVPYHVMEEWLLDLGTGLIP